MKLFTGAHIFETNKAQRASYDTLCTTEKQDYRPNTCVKPNGRKAVNKQTAYYIDVCI